MEWIKIPTDSILYSEFKDTELLVIIKYQALFCQLEKEPSEAQLLRIFTKKELKFIELYKEVVQELCENQINSVARKRNKDKENYKQKQSLDKNSASGKNAEIERNVEADKIREDKKRIDKKINKKSFLSEFETWWAEYPNKKSKQDAQRIFEKLLGENQVTFDELLAGAKAYAEHCRREKTDPHYIKHPSTWLNQGCWADEYGSSIPANDDDFYRKLEALQ